MDAVVAAHAADDDVDDGWAEVGVAAPAAAVCGPARRQPALAAPK